MNNLSENCPFILTEYAVYSKKKCKKGIVFIVIVAFKLFFFEF